MAISCDDDVGLLFSGMILVAASELRFEDFVRLWPADLALAWELEARSRGWAFQQYGWGDHNRPE